MDRKLDIQIEEKIFGKTPCEFKMVGSISGIMNYYQCKHPDSRNCYPSNPNNYDLIPKYSSDMSCAWKVVEEMKKSGYSFSCWDVAEIIGIQSRPMAGFRKGPFFPDRISKVSPDTWICVGESMAQAICRAALSCISTGGGVNESIY